MPEAPYLGIADDEEPRWTHHRVRRSVLGLLKTRRFWFTFIVCVAVASTWYVRNWIVTGNPVYAYFYEIFGGRNINPEVMASAEKEWSANSAGIGRMGDTLWERIKNTWFFFVTWPNQAWRLQPFFPAFVWGAALVYFGRAMAALLPGRSRDPLTLRLNDDGLRYATVALVLTGALFAYHYVLATFYLYHIIIVLPVLTVFLAFALPYWQRWRFAFGGLVLLVGIMPGVTMGLMGFKVFGAVKVGPDWYESPMQLFAFRHPLPPENLMYEWRFGDDAAMFDYVNTRLLGETILTHENRHLAFDASITLVHLDDWEIQPLWELPPAEQIARLKEMGIEYYLKVPNEAAHAINERMGTDHWPVVGLAEVEAQFGGNVLYRLR